MTIKDLEILLGYYSPDHKVVVNDNNEIVLVTIDLEGVVHITTEKP